MADGSSSKVAFRDVVIVGGGCYGTFYAGQLLRAAERGKATFRRVLVVDRDPQCRFVREIGDSATVTLVAQEWGDFFDAYLSEAGPSSPEEPGDAIVPSPLMPHLMYEWLVRQARRRWPERLVRSTPLRRLGSPSDVAAALLYLLEGGDYVTGEVLVVDGGRLVK